MFLPLYPRRLQRPALQPGLRPARPGTYDSAGQGRWGLNIWKRPPENRGHPL